MIKHYISILLIGYACTLNSQNKDFCKQVSTLVDLVNNVHYQPKTINDSLSNNVYKLFLEEIDADRRFFTKQDLESFNVDQYKIDDYLNSKTCDFILKYTEVLQQRLTNSKSILNSLLLEKLDYTGKDSLHFNANQAYSYFKNEASVSRYWNKKVRYKLLSKLIENDSVFSNISKDFKRLEKDLKPKIIEKEICLINEIENQNGGLSTFVEEAFLNAFLKYQDPNSSFFNISDKSLFEQSVANSQLTIGIKTRKTKNGDIVISYIVPGSSAFKNGTLDIDDKIIALSYGNNQLDTYCVSNKAITEFINNAAFGSINLKIKKQNGSIKSVVLKKSELKVEDNSIRGYIIEGTSHIGYIKIPSFYTDLESANGLGLANDVAKQLYIIQRENIEGLILDLRFNGGGSMKEAAELSGMFIDRGPVTLIKNRKGDIFTIKDANRGTVFTKPIVVLVNHFSASASEFFAGVMQDYNAAIIVGTQTHGKASAQTILPLNTTGKLGFAKLTIEKFYRVTGQSHQAKGILPDITLPNLYNGFKTDEGYSKYVLANDTTSVTLKHRPKPRLNIGTLKTQSSLRISKNPAFKTLKDVNKTIVANYINKKVSYPITLNAVYNDLKNYEAIWTNFSDFTLKQKTSISIRNSASTDEILSYNKDDIANNATLLKELSQDVFIEEAYLIINDILKTY